MFCKEAENILAKKELFRGVGTAIVTPFTNGEIDFNTFGRLIDEALAHADALIVAGTTGEAPTLTEKERDALLSFALARTEGHIPVIMGTGSNDTAHAVTLSRRACEMGADGVLVVTPYYNRGTREGIKEHFWQVAEASDAPVILYNVPARTGGNLTLSDYEAILPHPNILGVKEAEENTEKFFLLCEEFGKEKRIYTGSDAFLLPAMALGGAGVISVISNVFPDKVKRVLCACEEGDADSARHHFGEIFPLIRLLFAETSPAPVKEALCVLGYGSGECRLPLTPPTPLLRARIHAEIFRLTSTSLS